MDAAQTAPRQIPVAVALRKVLRRGYTLSDARADLFAGLVVGVLALPLSMALAIAVGAPPQHGLYTAIVAGVVTAVLGGCKFQVTGPTAAFVVVLAPIVSKYGLVGLLTAGFMAGVILLGLGLAKVGRLIQYVPLPVTTGFTTGIATVIAVLQLKDALGLTVSGTSDHFVGKLGALWAARMTVNPADLATTVATIGLLLGLPRVLKRIPAPLVAIVVVTGATTLLHYFVPEFEVATIGTRFHSTVNGVDVAGVPSALPTPSLPWGSGLPSFTVIHELSSAAMTIALLGAIESLLSAVIADGMTGTKHDPNAELVGLGIANMVAPIFGGIAATGALARTATNIRSGARSPFAAVVHAAVVLFAMLLLAPAMAHVPMACLAALLLKVAWNMSEVRQFTGVIRVAPKSDIFILVGCFLLTVFFDMVVAVTVGFVAAAILFMRRMAELTETRIQLDSLHEEGPVQLPEGTILYEINGPLFFGAAQTAMQTLHTIRSDDFRVLILNLARVPVIDATGFAALERAIDRAQSPGHTIILSGPLPKPTRVFDKACLEQRYENLRIVPNMAAALEAANELSIKNGVTAKAPV